MSAVAPGVPTVIVSYVVTPTLTHLMGVELGGTNIARFYLTINGTVRAQHITYFSGPLDGAWDFRALDSGLVLAVGDTIRVSVTHLRPMPGDFYARLNLLLVTDA